MGNAWKRGRRVTGARTHDEEYEVDWNEGNEGCDARRALVDSSSRIMTEG